MDRRRHRGAAAWWFAAALAALLLLSWWGHNPGRDPGGRQAAPAEPANTAVAAAVPAPSGSSAAPASRSPFTPASLQARQRELAGWRQRLEQAQQTLEAYRASTRYPHESRPLAEQRDQTHPNRPVEEEMAWRTADAQAVPGVQLRTSQERVFLLDGESVHLSVSLHGEDGRALPLRVTSAVAREIPPPHAGSLYPVQPVNFNDEGLEGDVRAGDGVHGVRLHPQRQGFAGLDGQLRVELALQHGRQQASAYFDMVLTGAPPATWSGGVREALEEGALNFYLPAEVREPGRYVVSGRLDDATGEPFALLTFNDEVGAGAQEFRLSLFGKLVRDAKPVFPLTLRDVDAFLLRPDSFPDRALMERRVGRVHLSATHPLAAFSAAEWESEERSRYLAELQREVREAQEQVERHGRRP
ncbi:hypothetical protein [Caldimonas tepidiphila]|uniref:hypothetical protein n=1 Tax=Caldimonas tepidiphila TaxID=2315841 RepID=UPI000E5C4FD4|nr:hypothetical protein [Caldimonas tepidiphila]